MGRPLTFKQGLFVEHFLGESAGNAVDAARRAGYRVPEIVGRRVASKSIVQAAIAAKVAAAAMTSNEVLARVADLASVDLLEFLDIEPTGVFTVNLYRAKKAGLGHLVKRIRRTKDVVDIEVEARLPALVKLGEYYNL
ncbi:MAG: terminase small subunit [Isosphaeraceae bacterium]